MNIHTTLAPSNNIATEWSLCQETLVYSCPWIRRTLHKAPALHFRPRINMLEVQDDRRVSANIRSIPALWKQLCKCDAR